MRLVEDAAVAVLDEVAPAFEVEGRPADVVGIGEDAVLEEALAAAQRQQRRVDGDAGARSEGAQEDQRREGALATADDRDRRLLVLGDAGELLAAAVAVEDARLGGGVVREGAVDAGAGEGEARGRRRRRPSSSSTSQRSRSAPRATATARPERIVTPVARPLQHPAEVFAVVAVADRRRAGVDPRRPELVLDRVALPAERQQRGVDLGAGGAELAGAAVGEADVLDRRDRQRLLARGHAVAAEPGGGGVVFSTRSSSARRARGG